MNYFAASGLLNLVVSVSAGLFVYLKSPEKKINKSYFVLCLSIAMWSGCYWQWLIAGQQGGALFWTRALTASSLLIPISYFYFILVFLKLSAKKREKLLLRIFCAFGCFFFLISFSSLLVEGVTSKLSFQFWPEPGPVYPVYLALFFGTVIYTHFLMFDVLKKARGFKRNQIKYLFIGSLMGFGGGATNFLLWYDIPVYPFGNFAVLLFFLFYTYAVFKYRLMDINIIFKRTAAYSLSAGLLTGLFVVLVLAITNLFSTLTDDSSITVSIIVALVVVLLFNPLRNKIQSAIDKVFYKKTFDYYATIQRVSSSLASMFDLDRVYKFIGDVVYEVLGLRNIYVLALGVNGFESVYHLSSKGRGQRDKNKGTGADDQLRIGPRSGIVKYCKKTGEILVRDELPAIESSAGGDMVDKIRHDLDLMHGAAVVPVRVDRKLTLLLVLGEKLSGDMFGDEDINLLNTISDQTAIALKNAGLYKDKVNSERLASIGMMSATFAHEIRNPLTSLKTFAQLMPDKYNDEEFRNTFSKIVEGEIERIDGLITDLLDFSTEKKSGRVNLFNLIELVDETVEYVKGKLDLEDKYIEVEKLYGENEIMMSGDATKLKQTFLNIVTNACQAMNGDGLLTVKISESGKNADVTVTDNGAGIHPDDISKIFDPFVTTKEMGVGLGLAISKRIIEDHNGKISVKSKLSKGTAFTVSLPVQN